jgi:inner membrane protein
VEPVTHLVASVALARAGLRRARGHARLATPILITAGLIPELDFLSHAAGPMAYFRLHRAATHSLAGGAVLAFLVAGFFWWLGRKAPGREAKPGQAEPPISFASALALAAIGIAAHLLLDLGTSYGLRPFWPFSDRLYGWDLWAEVDPWILLALVAGIFLPALLGLVVSEIGARPKRRVSRGALAALIFVALYGVGRGALHDRACGLLASRLYHDRVPLAVGAFPSPASPFIWRGVAETSATIETLEVSLLPGASFAPEHSRTHFKPADSPALDRARATPVVAQWLGAARFPLATVEPIEGGYRIEFRDLRYASGGSRFFMPAAVVRLNRELKVTNERLVFGPAEWDAPRRLSLLRGAAEEPTGDEVSENHRRNDNQGELELVFDEIALRLGPVPDREKTLEKIAQPAPDKQRESKRPHRHLKNSRGEHERLEGQRRGKNRGDGNAQKLIAPHPVADASAARAGAAAKHRFPALFRQIVEPKAAGKRAERRHRGVIGHPCWIGDREAEQEQVVDEGERKDRGIEESDHEEAQPAERGDQLPEPVRQLHRRLGRAAREKAAGGSPGNGPQIHESRSQKRL